MLVANQYFELSSSFQQNNSRSNNYDCTNDCTNDCIKLFCSGGIGGIILSESFFNDYQSKLTEGLDNFN